MKKHLLLAFLLVVTAWIGLACGGNTTTPTNPSNPINLSGPSASPTGGLFYTPTITPTFGNGQEVITLDGQAGVTGIFGGKAVTLMSNVIPAAPTGTSSPGGFSTSQTIIPTIVRTPAQFNSPSAVAVDEAGTIYLADSGNFAIRVLDNGALVTTWVGQIGKPGLVNGPATKALLREVTGIAVDAQGDLYLSDNGNNIIRKVSPKRALSTLAGSGVKGSVNGKGTQATFWNPHGLAVDKDQNVYVADTSNQMIRVIDKEGVVRTLAGSGIPGAVDDQGSKASFHDPMAVALDDSGNLYVADTGNNLIRKITSDGRVTTVAGKAGVKGILDGSGNSALFDHPTGIAIDSQGTIYVADTGNQVVRKIGYKGIVSTVAGKAGVHGAADGTGPDATFHDPTGLAVNAWGSVVVVDQGNQLIRLIR